jgi:tetratricopeptide (TPR) repeat protein
MAKVPTHKILISSIFILIIILIGSAWNTGSRLFFPGENIDRLLQHAIRDYSTGQIDEAYFRLQEIEIKDPKNATVQYMLGQSLEAMGREDAAIIHYEKTLKLNPTQAAPYYNLAVIYNRRKDTEAAITQLQEALFINRDFHGARFMLAGLNLEQENFADAASDLERILRSDQERPFEIRVRLFLARAYIGLEENQKAREQYQKVIQLDHTNQEAQDGLIDLR